MQDQVSEVMASQQRPRVTVLFVTYKRVNLLERTVSSLLSTTTYPRNLLELIVCDDGSPRDIQNHIRSLPFDKFVLATDNKGMGANTNRGLRVATNEFILQLQDDWLCVGPSDFIDAALEVFAERKDVGMVRLRTPCPAAAEYHRTASGRIVHIYGPRAFAGSREYGYTDNPHLKRQSFHQVLGSYRESRNMCTTELEFARRVDRQQALRVAWIEGYAAFRHIGQQQSFNRGLQRGRLSASVSRYPMGRLVLSLYRALGRRWR